MKQLIFLVPYLLLQTTSAQLQADTMFTWRGYAQSGIARVQIYKNPADVDRPRTLVVQEIAKNHGPSVVAELPYLAEEIGRSFSFDPAAAFWVLHWGAFSFEDAKQSKKELFLRATFKRTKSRKLSSPQWRVIEREEVEMLTDRAFYQAKK